MRAFISSLILWRFSRFVKDQSITKPTYLKLKRFLIYSGVPSTDEVTLSCILIWGRYTLVFVKQIKP
jgi:hypothetical protein